jgi:hypothetical protein
MGHIRIVRLTKDASGHDLDGTRKIIAKVEQGLSFQRSMDKVEEKPAEQGGGNVGQGTGAAQGAEHSGPRQERARP